MDANKFLKELHKELTKQCWGEIDPNLFDPDLKYVPGPEKKWAKELQKTVKEVLGRLGHS